MGKDAKTKPKKERKKERKKEQPTKQYKSSADYIFIFSAPEIYFKIYYSKLSGMTNPHCSFITWYCSLVFLGSFVPLHDRILHFMVCVYFPLHVFPPPEGGGLVHERVRVFFPLPQVLLHLLYFDHSVKPPSTEIVEIKVIKLEHFAIRP